MLGCKNGSPLAGIKSISVIPMALASSIILLNKSNGIYFGSVMSLALQK
jgi:hypothetical protein